jgi:class 3 adenylate cyclase
MTVAQILAFPQPHATAPLAPHTHDDAPRIASLRAERKLITVMFVDVKSSMDLSRSIDLEAWWLLLAELFELMCDSVDRFGGWIANYTGDGIEAIFESESAGGDHASRACQAALCLRDAIRVPAAQLFAERGLELSIRIGINSGEVLIGMLGSGSNRYYTANGYPIALAKRIEGLAPPDRIYLAEHTAALVAGGLQITDLGAFDVRGAQAPVRVFELG